jgi:hypothetical protein
MKNLFLFICLFLPLSLNALTRINVHDWGNFTPKHIERFKIIINKVELIINSDQFKMMVESYKVNNVRTYVENNKMSNNHIYKNIMLGNELITPSIDLEWDISFYATSIPWMNTVIAYINKGSNVIFYNSTFLPQEDAQHARTICHEYVHLLGFYHKTFPNGPYIHSPAYAIGDICQYMYVSHFPDHEVITNPIDEIPCSFICWFKGLFK